ncbi:MAG: toll/interleukin-1 receptor domain-containing protein [Desulforhabdus sp.]|nr:toll/interleukin-1 receptor domain-containing protein [Desulforhabdus sp.]
MSDQRYVYIAHRADAKQFALRLAKDLRSYGIDPWLPSERIKPGDNVVVALEEGLRGAEAALLIISRAALESEWFRHELQAILGANKKVIPVKVDDVELPLFIRQLSWIDLSKGGYEGGLRKILAGLGDLVQRDEPLEDRGLASKGYVFLSYCEEDVAFVAKVKEFLAENGYAYWDYQESDRDYQSQLYLELQSIIRDAAATVCILSPSWRRSKWTVKEYLYSEDVGTPVFLLRATQMDPTLITAGIPYIDFVADEKAGFEKLSRELRRKRL